MPAMGQWWLFAEEDYPDFSVYDAPSYYAVECTIPNELVAQYIAARRAYRTLRDQLAQYELDGVRCRQMGANPDPLTTDA